MKSKNALLGVLAGIAAGALIGVLFAPEKGSKTRKGITRKGEDFVDVLKEKFKDLLETMTEKYEKVKDDVSDFVEKGNHKEKEA